LTVFYAFAEESQSSLLSKFWGPTMTLFKRIKRSVYDEMNNELCTPAQRHYIDIIVLGESYLAGLFFIFEKSCFWPPYNSGF
jgi:hypothetical protein